MEKPDPNPPTADRLRKDIDRGKAGDKVDYPDPAAAPLGTDEEAGGRGPSEAALAIEEAPDQPRRRPVGGVLTYLALIAGLLVAFGFIVLLA